MQQGCDADHLSKFPGHAELMANLHCVLRNVFGVARRQKIPCVDGRRKGLDDRPELLLLLLKEHDRMHVDGYLGHDAHEKVEVALKQRLLRTYIVHYDNAERLFFVDDRTADE